LNTYYILFLFWVDKYKIKLYVLDYEDKNDFLLNDDEKVTTSYSEERPQLADCINSNDVSVGGVSSK